MWSGGLHGLSTMTESGRCRKVPVKGTLTSCLTVLFSRKKKHRRTLLKYDFIQKIFLFACMLNLYKMFYL